MRILLITLLVTVLVGFIAYARYGNAPEETPVVIQEKPTVEVPVLHEYLMFSKALSRGDFIRKEDLKWVNLDPGSANVPSYAIRRGDLELADLEGALVMNDSLENTYANRRVFLLPQQNRYLATVLQPGKRAISIAVNLVSGSSGLIQPGDRVDVILHTEMNTQYNDEKIGFLTKTVIQDVRVIAINRKTAYHVLDERDNPDSTVEFSSKSTATLELTPHQAEEVTMARNMGTLSLSLRSYFEHEAPRPAQRSTKQAMQANDVIRNFPKPVFIETVEVVELAGTQRRVKTFRTDVPDR